MISFFSNNVQSGSFIKLLENGSRQIKTIYPPCSIQSGIEMDSRGGGLLDISLGGGCGAAPHTLTLFKTNIADFPTLFKTEFRFLIPCLRY